MEGNNLVYLLLLLNKILSFKTNQTKSIEIVSWDNKNYQGQNFIIRHRAIKVWMILRKIMFQEVFYDPFYFYKNFGFFLIIFLGLP